MKKNKLLYNILLIGIVLIGLIFLNIFLDNYKVTIINLCGIYIILALSMNLINGFTGLFSLGHAGFMAIGAYTVAILTMPTAAKEMNFYMKPMAPFLLNLNMPFILALIMGGLMAAIFGFLIGAPVLKLTDDYLAIATLGFSEIIRVVIINMQSITNGSLGLKGIPKITNDFLAGIFKTQPKVNLLWSWGIAILTIVFMKLLMKGSYGKAFKAIREDEIAARSMGINLFKHKVMSFTIGSFLAGVGGGLLAASLGTIDPTLFKFALTFNILLMVVLGGMGNINGTAIAAIIITIAMEALRFLDEPMNLGFMTTPALPGLRMVVFSLILMLVVIFKKDGFIKNALGKVRGKYAKN
ncbi:amino acid/amide ABC transporter membrane protein 2, HAAT family (TC 3.A.1.4.-) [Tissierella praeacuta DSM 18095]|uniref:Amino acid/amide ABC transporter membrane protein 2, HAAT family (TC 3.A.1.4.-) n=1 Tax=Tissierella praeacuta DSM 18095 TaxID=1123404 RepID=A0A1M4WKR6_9FIRM|nr:branched-chain amino acid ABC transporter permease [Tissierella praeacuta]TCU79114.1 amino acid/amide ABC transporter membrane protein 2 (HAAT family) [Tissierella praeacuta]SHE81859.1 amino acid/amide ABC transporter membrane protein 2, HAAT family (TC 3.A.1.4.-) [Tissierella praeacuta DSM 18095]SUO99338.1 leucine/isoleucine/valine transporter permease subunit [Tissierella praeacuta]